VRDDDYDNDGFGKCPVKGCAGWVVGGTCEACGEDFNGPEWQDPPELKVVEP
jgi:hypothetical protein